MIRGPQATGDPTCVATVQLTGFYYLKKRAFEGILIQGPLRTSYASGTESNQSVPSNYQQHLFVFESPLNLEVTPDAPTIDTERRKLEVEIG
ncbi:hypothetical protein TNCV_830061 [Trichonephila clavipes]|nr:hypothetical protein TNCV_830061 [Trichonephila clavipes]